MGHVVGVDSELEYIVQWKQHAPTECLLKCSKVTDVVLAHVDGTLIPVHRAVLAVSSSYFAQLFGQLTSSGFENSNTVVLIKDIPIDLLKDLVNFIYEGKVIVKQSRLRAFLTAAVELNLYGLVQNFLEEEDQGLKEPEGRSYFNPEFPSPCKSLVSQRSTSTFDSGLDLRTRKGAEDRYSDRDFPSPTKSNVSRRSSLIFDSRPAEVQTRKETGDRSISDQDFFSPSKSQVSERSTSTFDSDPDLDLETESPAKSGKQKKEKASVKRSITKETKKRTRKYKNYSFEQLQEALQDVKGGMPCTRAGLKHSVPSRTLYQIIANQRAANVKDDEASDTKVSSEKDYTSRKVTAATKIYSKKDTTSEKVTTTTKVKVTSKNDKPSGTVPATRPTVSPNNDNVS